jgi:acetyl esterase/lipase
MYNVPSKKGAGARPSIVFFFGGGWSGGTTERFLPQALHFSERGMTAFIADYRVKERHGTTRSMLFTMRGQQFDLSRAIPKILVSTHCV